MTPQTFIRTLAKAALSLFVILALTALAQKITAQEAPRLSVSGGGLLPTQAPPVCPSTVLPNNGGTSANERAPNTNFRFGRAVYLITAAELAANGYTSGNSVTTLGWNYSVGNAAGASAPLVIYLQNTADTTNTKSTTFATAITGMTTVHNAVTALPSVAGPFDITLTGGSPFTYTGGGLYVAFDWGQYTGTLSTTATVLCNTALPAGLLGGQSSTAAPATLAASAFRPETRLSSSTTNDAAVNAVYSLGELPLGLVPPQIIQAVITNKGANALSNLMATLSITGVDSFMNTQTISSLAACGAQAVVSFAGFTPTAIGNDTVTVSVPADSVPTNNSLSHPLAITSLSYSYKYPGTTATGGVGFTGAAGALVAKFTTTAANAVTDVKLEFPVATPTATYKVVIFGDSGSGTPSTTPLYLDASDRVPSVAGPITITLPSPVAVGPGNFFVGIEQTGTVNIGLGFDTESPIRAGSFYEASPLPPATFFDFSPGGDFKLNIGILLQTPAASGPIPSAVVSRKTHGGAGNFDISLPLVPVSGAVGIEDRSGPNFTIVVTFPSPVTVGSVAVTTGTGSATFSVVGGVVTINLTGVTDAQRIAVTLTNVNNGTSTGNVIVPMGVLLGDTNGSGGVSAADVAQTKGQSGLPTTASNFRTDVNTSGSISAADVALVKSKAGSTLPP